MTGAAPKGLQLKVAKTVRCLACNRTFKTKNKHQHICLRSACQRVLDGRSAHGYDPPETSDLEDLLK